MQVLGFDIVIHPAAEGGFWAEVPDIPGCATEADRLDELLSNPREAIEGCLSVTLEPPTGGCQR